MSCFARQWRPDKQIRKWRGLQVRCCPRDARALMEERIMITSKGRLICGGALAVVALVLGLPAMAGAVTAPDVAVRYNDLDVDTVSGATQLLQRIESAADRVCARLDHGDLASRGNVQRCEQKLTA